MPLHSISITKKLVFILTMMAPNILTLNGLHDSAKSTGEINIAHVNSRTKDKSATGAIDHAASDVTKPSFDSVKGPHSSKMHCAPRSANLNFV